MRHESVDDFVDGAVAPEGHDDVEALSTCLLAEGSRVVAMLSRNHLEVELGRQCGEDDVRGAR